MLEQGSRAVGRDVREVANAGASCTKCVPSGRTRKYSKQAQSRVDLPTRAACELPAETSTIASSPRSSADRITPPLCASPGLGARAPARAGTPGTSTPCGCRRPGRASGSVPGTAGTACRRCGRPAAPTRPSSVARRISRAAAPSTARSSSSETSPSGRQGDMRSAHSDSALHTVPSPETSRWSRSASPTSRAWSPRRRLASMRSKSGSRARMSGPSRCTAREFSSRTRPPYCSACALLPRSTSHGRPNTGASRAITRQLPDMRRWLRTVTPPSKRRIRFFPTASTDSSTRPSTCSATPVTWPRGFGDSALTRSPTRTCSRRAARWRLSPSGTGHDFVTLVSHGFPA